MGGGVSSISEDQGPEARICALCDHRPGEKGPHVALTDSLLSCGNFPSCVSVSLKFSQSQGQERSSMLSEDGWQFLERWEKRRPLSRGSRFTLLVKAGTSRMDGLGTQTHGPWRVTGLQGQGRSGKRKTVYPGARSGSPEGQELDFLF